VYATVFSGFYVALYLFLAALVFRAVAIEFRSKEPMRWWRSAWDVGFSAGSASASLILGVALGNLVWGVPLGQDHVLRVRFLELLHPYALLTGVTTLALFMMHGAIYLHLKTDGAMQQRVRTWIRPCIIFFVVSYAVLSAATLVYIPRATSAIREHPLLFVVPVLSILAIANIPREIHFGRPGRAFLSSCATLVLLLALFGINVYPEFVHSRLDPDYSLTIYDAASSQKTLGIMTIIAVIGLPLVLSYTVGIYWVFRGKVTLTETSY
jgi:cytochrome d ubiquinol oxidase subunit II